MVQGGTGRGGRSSARVALVPRQLKKQFLAEVRRALSGELGGLADELEVDHDALVHEASNRAPEILAPVIDDWDRLEEARRTRVAESSWPPLFSRWLHRLRNINAYTRVVFLVLTVLALATAVLPLIQATLFVVGSVNSLILFSLLLGIGLIAIREAYELTVPDAEGLRRERLLAAERQFTRKLREFCVNAWLTQRLNKARSIPFDIELIYRGSPRLAEVDDPRHEIPTAARDRLVKMLKRMPGGAIGLAGPRGVGKSTLMRSVCREKGEQARSAVHVLVDAPVEYEPREFILHLFAQVCSKIVGEEEVSRLRQWDRPFKARSGLVAAVRSHPHQLLGPLLVLLGAALRWWPALSSSINVDRHSGGTVLLAVGAVMTFATAVLEAPLWRRALKGRLAWQREPEQRRDVNTALLRLRQIWFQQTYSSGWSGGFKAPLVALEGKLSGGTELADRQMSYPDVVRLFRDFLGQISSGQREVRIGIDELDKMEAEAAHRFLNHIKTVFRIPNCFFFVSVSEDAMSAFERRGVPFRDVLDSSFDDVVRVPHLELSRSIELIQRRVVGLPQPFAYLLHGLSGGLPRDLIRAARELFELEKGTKLSTAAAYLTSFDLRERAFATRVAARQLQAEEGRALLSEWLQRVEPALGKPQSLLAICEHFGDEFLDELQFAIPDESLASERRELRRLATEVAVACYLVATMLELCEMLESTAIKRDSDRTRALVDQLATAFQSSPGDLELAWETVSGARRALDLSSVAFPRDDPQSEGRITAHLT